MADDCPGGKSSWPELVGAEGKVAEEIIEKENPYVDAQIILEGTPITKELSCTRVRVWVDTNGIVTRVPRIG